LKIYPKNGIIGVYLMKKKLEWITSSKKDLMEFPANIRKEMGYALYIAQQSGKYRKAKPLRGFGNANLLEIVLDDNSGTYRTMYTIQFEEIVFVLHAFQKKSNVGIKTNKQDLDLVKQRLKMAQQKYSEWLINPKR
jgi:phage-related protein